MNKGKEKVRMKRKSLSNITLISKGITKKFMILTVI